MPWNCEPSPVLVIRHAETRDYEAIRQIHAQPEVYYN
ncbi:hypothetical protein U4Y45_12625, partial [Escherichia coli]|nr:hypothetical protein [Escherichia coli]